MRTDWCYGPQKLNYVELKKVKCYVPPCRTRDETIEFFLLFRFSHWMPVHTKTSATKTSVRRRAGFLLCCLEEGGAFFSRRSTDRVGCFSGPMSIVC